MSVVVVRLMPMAVVIVVLIDFAVLQVGVAVVGNTAEYVEIFVAVVDARIFQQVDVLRLRVGGVEVEADAVAFSRKGVDFYDGFDRCVISCPRIGNHFHRLYFFRADAVEFRKVAELPTVQIDEGSAFPKNVESVFVLDDSRHIGKRVGCRSDFARRELAMSVTSALPTIRVVGREAVTVTSSSSRPSGFRRMVQVPLSENGIYVGVKPIAEILTNAFVVGEARVNSPFSSVRVLASNVESGILNAAMLANSTGCKSALLTTFRKICRKSRNHRAQTGND